MGEESARESVPTRLREELLFFKPRSLFLPAVPIRR